MQLSKIEGTNRLYQLECLRGFAAVYVVAFHVLRPELQPYSYLLSIPFRFGQEAVIIFFVLSGFVIHYSWTTGPKRDWAGYAVARIVRILPIFAVALVISYLCAAWLEGRFIDPDVHGLFGNLAMLQDRFRSGTIVEPYMGNAALWSLSYEAAFYVLYPLVMRLVPEKTRTLAVGTVSIAAFLVMLVYPNQLARFIAYFSIWWIGVVLCDTYLGRARRRDIVAAAAPVGFISAILAFMALRTNVPLEIGASIMFPFLELRHFMAALVIMAVLLGWASLGWRGFAALFGPFAKLAPISYAIYVIHFPIMTAWRESFPLPFWQSVVLTGVLTLALASFLEGGYQRWAGRRLRGFLERSSTGAAKGPWRLVGSGYARRLAIVGTMLPLALWLNLTDVEIAHDHPVSAHVHSHIHDGDHAHGNADAPAHAHLHSHEAKRHAHVAG